MTNWAGFARPCADRAERPLDKAPWVTEYHFTDRFQH
jgi:hypothetical protein